MTKPFFLSVSFLLFVTICMFYPLFLQGHLPIQHDLHVSDLNNFSLPFRANLGDGLASGSFPLWNKNALCGVPTIAHIQMGACYPLTWFCYGLFPLPWAHNLYIALCYFIAALGMHLLCRQWEYCEEASLVGGLSFAFCGFLCCHLRHLAMLSTACWLPLIVATIEAAFRKMDYKYPLYFALLWAMQLLAGHPQIAYYCCLFYCFYLCSHLFLNRSRGALCKKLLLLFLVALLLGTTLASVQLLPTYELSNLWWRGSGVTYKEAIAFPYHIPDLLNFFRPGINGDPGNCSYKPRSSFYENYGYIGLLPIILSLVGAVIAIFRRGKECFMLLFGVFAFFMLLGPATPLFSLAFHYLPGMSFFRHPTRFMLLLNFILAFLAAFAWQQGRAKFAPTKRVKIGLFLLLIIALDLVYHQQFRFPSISAKKWLEPPQTAQFLMKENNPYRYYSVDAPFTHLATYRVAGGWWGDLRPYILQREFLQPSINLLWDISSADGYINMTPERVTKLWGYSSGKLGLVHKLYERVGPKHQPSALKLSSSFIKLMSLYNVKFFVSMLPLQNEAINKVSVNSGALLYQNRDVLERTFIVHRYLCLPDKKEQLEKIISPEFYPRGEVLLEKTVKALAPGKNESLIDDGLKQKQSKCKIIKDENNEVIIEATMSHRGFLVLADNYYPGWQAYLEGKAIPLFRANYNQRAVFLPKGKHLVTFRFSPNSVKMGLILTLISAITLFASYLHLRRK